jgi:hypothetical protein
MREGRGNTDQDFIDDIKAQIQEGEVHFTSSEVKRLLDIVDHENPSPTVKRNIPITPTCAFVQSSVPVYARFSDDDLQPIICWQVEDIGGNEFLDEQHYVLVGMVLEEKTHFLLPVTEATGFVQYEHIAEKPTHAQE